MYRIVSILFIACILMQGKADDRLPEGAVPFIYDGHLYFPSCLNDSNNVTLIYDTGADFLYLDHDFLKLSGMDGKLGRKGVARMGGAGNSDTQKVDIFIDSIKVSFGESDFSNMPTPVIKLRDILGRHTDGLLGNTHLFSKPLYICFSKGYLLQMDSIPSGMKIGFTKINGEINDNRIDVKASLIIDSINTIAGTFRMDIGCGSALILTTATVETLDLSSSSKAYFSTQAGGIGGGSEEFLIRAKKFQLLDTLENVVVSCSRNQKGALSDRKYLGLIGNEILSLYDIIIDAADNSIYFKRTDISSTDYQHSSRLQMSYVDRTDICDGWVINGIYKNGIAEKTGIEINDIIVSINGRPVKEIGWEEQRNGLGLNGNTTFIIRKPDGHEETITLPIGEEII